MKTSLKLMVNACMLGVALAFANVGHAQVVDCNPNGEDSLETFKQYSLYREDFKNKRYDEAYHSWLYVFTKAPCFREQTYADGPELIEVFIKRAGKDTLRRRQLLDTLDLIYSARIKYFGREGFVKGKWGRDILVLDANNLEKGIGLIEEAIALDGNKVEDANVVPYFQALTRLEIKKKRTKDDVLKAYERLTDIIDYNLKNATEIKLGIYRTGLRIGSVSNNSFVVSKPEALEVGQSITFKPSFSAPRYEVTNIDSNLVTVTDSITEADSSELFYVKNSWKVGQETINQLAAPYLDCKTLADIYGPKFKADPTNVELLSKILLYLNNARCLDNDLYFQVAEAYLQSNPDIDGYRNLAKAYKQRKSYNKAFENYEKAIAMETSEARKVSDYLNMARIALDSGNPQTAKNYAEKALAISSVKGEAYIIIGDAYVRSAGGCSEKIDANAIYWVAVDMYIKAKTVEPGISGLANRRIATYSRYFPDKSKAFFFNITEGSTYTLSCWPFATTKARF